MPSTLRPIVDNVTLMSRLVPSVDELAEELRAVDGDAAARLGAAIDTGRELTKVSDALVEQFVVEARMDGLRGHGSVSSSARANGRRNSATPR